MWSYWNVFPLDIVFLFILENRYDLFVHLLLINVQYMKLSILHRSVIFSDQQNEISKEKVRETSQNSIILEMPMPKEILAKIDACWSERANQYIYF